VRLSSIHYLLSSSFIRLLASEPKAPCGQLIASSPPHFIILPLCLITFLLEVGLAMNEVSRPGFDSRALAKANNHD
jgi:hypothetical protein